MFPCSRNCLLSLFSLPPPLLMNRTYDPEEADFFHMFPCTRNCLLSLFSLPPPCF